MAGTHSQFLLTTATYFLVSASTARADWGNGPWDGGDGNGPWDGCGWGNGNDCNGSSNGGSSSSNGDPSTLALTQDVLNRTNRILTLHAVFASLVWVFLIPVGGIIIRSGIKSPWVLRIHAFLQSISYLIYIVAVGMGIYLVRELSNGAYSLWSDPHPKIGIAVLVLAFSQPISGLVHHAIYKRRAAAAKAGTSNKMPGRTAPGYVHLWLGRALIVLGMINGGLGLRLASRRPFEIYKRSKTIAYGVGAGVMFLLYLVFVIRGEIRRSRERKELAHQHQGVPLVARDGEGVQRSGPVAPAYRPPPSYEDSQETIRKEAETVARYT